MRTHAAAIALDAVLTLGLATGFATGAAAAPNPPPGVPYIGEVRAFAFNYCPSGWLPANGGLLPVAQNQALFSLLGTSYGGNGMSTFALPDLRGRAPAGTPQGGGLGQLGSAPVGGQARFVSMTWCIAVQGNYPARSMNAGRR